MNKDINDIVNSTIKNLDKLWLEDLERNAHENIFIKAIAAYLGYHRFHLKWTREQCKVIKAIHDFAQQVKK